MINAVDLNISNSMKTRVMHKKAKGKGRGAWGKGHGAWGMGRGAWGLGQRA